MPIPTPTKGESEDDFISRCISTMKKTDTDRDDDQISAICYDKWNNRRKSGKRKVLNRGQNQDRS